MKKLSTKKIVTKKRLTPTEQVREKVQGTGFGVKGTYTPLKNLSIAQIRDLLIASVWIDVCINTIVDEVVKYPLITDPADEEIDALLKYPSEKEPLFTIRKKYLKDMLRYGNGACVIGYKSSVPSSLTVTPGYLLRMTEDEPPKYKILKMDSTSEFLKKGDKDIVLTGKELMHFQIDADSDSTLARSPLERVYSDLVSDRQIGTALATFTSKGFFLPSFIDIEKANKGEIEDFTEFMNNILSEGAKVVGLNKKATLTAIPFWSADDIVKIQRWMALKIANTFKVPPFMLNLIEDTGSLNAREQKNRFVENVVLPILEYESYIYTMALATKGFEKPDVIITSPAVGTKLNFDKARIARLLAAKGEVILTVDELRKMFFNLDPIETKKKK
jgi:hypothetical protein